MTPAARRIVCPTCTAGPGVPCRFGRSSVSYHHVARKVAAEDAGIARRKEARATGKRPTLSVSAAAYEQIKAEAKRRGMTVTAVVEQRIAKLTGKEIA